MLTISSSSDDKRTSPLFEDFPRLFFFSSGFFSLLDNFLLRLSGLSLCVFLDEELLVLFEELDLLLLLCESVFLEELVVLLLLELLLLPLFESLCLDVDDCEGAVDDDFLVGT